MTDKQLTDAVRDRIGNRGLMRAVKGEDDARPCTDLTFIVMNLIRVVHDDVRGRAKRAKAIIELAERLANGDTLNGDTLTGYNSLVTYRLVG